MNQLNESRYSLIPRPEVLEQFLEIESCTPQCQLIFSQMLNPLAEVLSVDGKKIRFELVEIAYKALGGVLNDQSVEQLQICGKIIEGLHLGSMIIDDIQDQSEIRRGKAAYHRKHGLGPALNAGNWLYFQAIQQVQSLKLDPLAEMKLQRKLNEILLKAHFGQGIDVGVNMTNLPQAQVEATYFTAAELKTGSLMTLAFELGASLVDVDEGQKKGLSKLAKKFGLALQILDDIGNYLAPPPKGKEDLKIGRPSFIWVAAARLAPPADYERFKTATRMLPDVSFIDSWCALFGLIPEAKKFALNYVRTLKDEFVETSLKGPVGSKCPSSPDVQEELRKQIESLFSRLEKSYD